ncbi:Sigma-70 region 2 [Caulifigura coniformis]|uniref:Sigma-70 region 2 n=1 Tax=Caulifigura coniformis TaxID=2527983 RepID=A0A517SIJ2_9PLAN|nr:sigma-70 family RNA polymerase sigma factor [Caulifigura coniformis]QDT55940.1 Sigma-70 region 2 [Caulifigura coniformis]
MAFQGGDGGPSAEDPTKGYAGDLIRWKARRMALQLGLCKSDEDDIAQTLRLEVLKRSKAYRPERGAWKPFLETVIDRRCRTLAGKYLRSRRQDLMDGSDMGGAVSQADHFRRVHRGAAAPSDQPEIRFDVREIVNRMSDQDRALCRGLSAESISEMARRQGVARSTLQDHIRRLRKSFDSLNPTRKPPADPRHHG